MESMNILFIDAKCLICNKIVAFIFQRDQRKVIYFCNLQDPKALEYLPAKYVENLQTVVLFEDGVITTKSDAAIRVLVLLGHGAFKYLRLIPRGLRDFVYEFIARHRYKIGRELKECPLPSKDLASRFI